jgi:hypothetical protein
MFFSTIKLRLAKLEDIDLIHQTILSDASKGHYSRDYLSGDEAKLALKSNLNSMILNKIRYQTIWYNNKLVDICLNATVIIAEKNKVRTDAIETERVEKDRALEQTERERIVTLAQIDKERSIEVEKKNIQGVIKELVLLEKGVIE